MCQFGALLKSRRTNSHQEVKSSHKLVIAATEARIRRVNMMLRYKPHACYMDARRAGRWMCTELVVPWLNEPVPI